MPRYLDAVVDENAIYPNFITTEECLDTTSPAPFLHALVGAVAHPGRDSDSRQAPADDLGHPQLDLTSRIFDCCIMQFSLLLVVQGGQQGACVGAEVLTSLLEPITAVVRAGCNLDQRKLPYPIDACFVQASF